VTFRKGGGGRKGGKLLIGKKMKREIRNVTRRIWKSIKWERCNRKYQMDRGKVGKKRDYMNSLKVKENLGVLNS